MTKCKLCGKSSLENNETEVFFLYHINAETNVPLYHIDGSNIFMSSNYQPSDNMFIFKDTDQSSGCSVGYIYNMA